MVMIDQLFVLILKFSALAFVLLAVGVMMVRLCKQPVERIRLIQVALASVFLAALVGQSGWVPSLELAWLPGGKQPQSDADARAAASEAARASIIRGVDEPESDVDDEGHEASTQAAASVGPDLPLASPESVASSTRRVRVTPWSITRTTLVVLFVIISCVQAGYFLFGYFLTHRLIACAIPLELSNGQVIDEFRRELAGDRLRLAMSHRISVPIVSGILAPTIVLPKQLVRGEVDSVRLRHSLDHEWKHIERNDLVTWQLTSVCQIVLWPQPFYWMLRRELRLSQDQIADQFASREQAEQVAYATTLLEFSQAKHVTMLGALTMAGSKSNLFRRVEMLLNTEFTVAGFSRKRVVFGFASLMAVASFLLVSLQLTHATNGSHPAAPADEQVAASADQPEKEEPAGREQATEAVEHAGFVFDVFDGKPVADATVTVTRMRSDTWQEIAVTECQTDGSGKFVFTIPTEQLNQRYLYIMFDLRHATYAPRHCGSYSYGMIRKNLKLGAEPWFKKLQMVPGEKLSGRFVDERGNPVAGAAVRVNSKDPTVEGFVGQSSSDSVTGDDGRFEAIVTAGGNASVSVIPLQYCMKHVDLGKKRGDIGDVTLSEGIAITGHVVDAVGDPLEGIWVNLTASATEREASYEAKRSSKTDHRGGFRTRPLKPGQYVVTVETKATGALEKDKYANFHDTPPPAVFVRQTIEVAEASNRPFVIQAVPHIYIKGQCYNPQGEITSCHFPNLTGQFNGQFMWIHARKGEQVGEFELMVPHGVESAQLRFSTNEHTGLTIQFAGKQPSPQRNFRFDTVEADILDIKVVRYVAPILQVKVVDESGKEVTDARVLVKYPQHAQASNQMMQERIVRYFEKQDDGVFRSSSLVPDIEFEVFAEKAGFESERKRMTMKEGTNETIRIDLKPTTTSEIDAAAS